MPGVHVRSLALTLLISSTTGCAGPAATSTAPGAGRDQPSAAAAVAEVRRGYFGRDWWACARAGDALLVQHPDSAPLRAWTITCAARSGEDALARADAMLSERPGDPWGSFARASALIDDPERGPVEGIAAARAAAQALAHPDMTWLVGRALVIHGTREQAATYLTDRPDRAASPELLGLELALLAMMEGDVASQLHALAGQIRRLDPRFVDAWYVPAVWLLGRRRAAEAEPLVQRALELSPYAPAIHALLWDAISQSTRSPADKRGAIDADVAALLRVRGDGPVAVNAAAYAYDDLSPETAKRLRGEVMTRFPDSREADWVRIEAIRALEAAWYASREKHGKPDPAAGQALQAAVVAFLARPRHAVPSLVGEATMKRYFLVEADEAADPDALLAAARGVVDHERHNIHVFAGIATTLAGRTRYHAEAEAVARHGLRLAAQQAARTPPTESSAEHTRYLRGLLLCGLGAAMQAQGRLAEARDALQQARTLAPTSAQPVIRLAALAEAEGQPAEAEQQLSAGLGLEYDTDTIATALKALYRRRHGSDRGFDRYRAGIERGLREQRRAAVLATRISEPQPLPPFTLPRLTGGGEVRSEALAGRVVVLNLWATFCHPCVEEMPALQQLADKFAGSPDVVISSINTDAQTDTIAAWMAERGHRFEVLLGGRWFVDVGYSALPTTLFVDADGNVVFVKEGATDRLVEEFSWRIDAMRRKPGNKRGRGAAVARG